MPLCHGYAVDWEREDDKLCVTRHSPPCECHLLSFSSGELALPRSSGLKSTAVGEEENFLYPSGYFWMA